MNIKQSGVLYFQFMRIVILFFRQFSFVVANDCECEVEGWSNWSGPDATCGSAIETRQRVCKTPGGWALELLKCNAEHVLLTTKYQDRNAVLPACRKLSLNVKLCQVIFSLLRNDVLLINNLILNNL